MDDVKGYLKDLAVRTVVADLITHMTSNKYAPDRDQLKKIVAPIFDRIEQLENSLRAEQVRFTNLMSEHSKARAQADAFKYTLDILAGRPAALNDPSLLVEAPSVSGCGCASGACCTPVQQPRVAGIAGQD